MSSNKALYFLTGLGIGVAAAILFAPESGSDLRGFLRNKSDEGKKYAGQAVSDAAVRAKQKTEELKKTAGEKIEHGKQAVREQLETLGSAVEAGKKAYEEASKDKPADQAT